MSGPQIKAPSHDYGLLTVPPMPDWGTLAQENHDSLMAGDPSFGRRGLKELRRLARRDFLTSAKRWNPSIPIPAGAAFEDALWIMTGHQPELYHPGVWAKNFAVASAAQAASGFGFNLVADTDQLKSNKIRVPSGSTEHFQIQQVPLDEITDGRPYEAWHLHNAEEFRAFGEQVRQSIAPDIENPLIDHLWEIVTQDSTTSGSQAISRARQAIENDWGFGLTEAPMSLWAETEAVQHVFCMILADMPRFHAIHEEELRDYRRLHKIRSRNHPVADLEHDENDWWEAPLWVWRDSTPIRERLWVRICKTGAGVELRIDGETDSIGCLPIRPDMPTADGIAQLGRLAESGIRIRPRALVTTALCRTLLADLFVHGIGGAIYDELGDQIFCRFFGMRPPQYAVMSATLRLFDFPPPVISEKLREQNELRRRIQWKGDTLPIADSAGLKLVAQKRALLELPVEERKTRRYRATQLRRVNRELANFHDERLREVESSIEGLRHEADLETLARSREFSIAVHSCDRLRKLAEEIRIASTNSVPS